jgi:2-polyprenyl-3-methyl-5-hydroxy-6-metoxy-1,4-benzoquinol methylase
MSAHQPTISYYNGNADAFRRRTMECKVTPLYDAFLSHLKPGDRILDAGCGPGRDSVVFLRRGFRVTAIDASSSMVELATKAMGQPAIIQPLQDIDYVNEFEGVWACASLLHLASSQIDDVLKRIVRALKPGGSLFISVKHGNGERFDSDGRLFCDYTNDSLRALLARQPMLKIVAVMDAPAGQINPQHWVYAIATKSAEID